LNVARDALKQVRQYLKDLQAVDSTLKPSDEVTGQEREAPFISLRQEWESSADPLQQQLAQVMRDFQPRLFVGGEADDVPEDN